MRNLSAQIQDIADWIAAIDLDPKPAIDDFSAGAMRAAWSAIAYLGYDGNDASFRERCCAQMRPGAHWLP